MMSSQENELFGNNLSLQDFSGDFSGGQAQTFQTLQALWERVGLIVRSTFASTDVSTNIIVDGASESAYGVAGQ